MSGIKTDICLDIVNRSKTISMTLTKVRCNTFAAKGEDCAVWYKNTKILLKEVQKATKVFYQKSETDFRITEEQLSTLYDVANDIFQLETNVKSCHATRIPLKIDFLGQSLEMCLKSLKSLSNPEK